MESEQHVVEAPAPSVATVPDAKPIDASAAASASAPKPAAKASSPVSVSALIKAAPASVDAFLARLLRCLETRAGADTVLFLLCYAARLAAAVLDGSARAVLRQSSQRLVDLATKLPPSATVTFTGPLGALPSAALASAAIRLAAKLKTFSVLLTDVRTFGRLWGLLGMYFGAKRFLMSRIAASKAPATDEKKSQAQDFNTTSVGTFFTAIKLATIIFFQATENITYLASKNVVGLAPTTTGTIARWSVRAFMYYVHIEVARGLIERAMRVADARGRGVSAATEDPAWDASWKRDFFRNLAWSPLTLHWAMDLGPLKLNELAIAAFGLYPACGQMRDLWRSTA